MRLKLLAGTLLLLLTAGAILSTVTCVAAAPLWTEFNGLGIPAQTLPDFVALAARLSPAHLLV